MVMEGNEYGHSVTLAAVPVSAFKCALSLSLSGLCPLVAVVSFKEQTTLWIFLCSCYAQCT